ncbi:uncharacterized protein FIBRA_09170 [Fibroporia radiculosa]|uniref:NAD(P)-binding protein n=1 Tax=Fibroporia radiculosa TaxID=599839 RepID=J4H5J8_9APHY|nr:uncharacterized protein FIBRA_09170 [Fibroporia radiculosa]CCM06864.1 predicted protein [Fibroporia radiculosa]
MPSIAAARASNAKYSPSYVPVAIFVGGTSGIGRAIAQAFARYTQGNAHIILCGRNEAAASSIIASFPRPTAPEAKHEFVQCDATLMKNVAATTSALLNRLPKVNFVVLSSGVFSLKGRNETSEGIDRKLALSYYARWKFTSDLMSLLREAKDAGEDAKVMSILGPGNGGNIDLDDLGLKKNYGVLRTALTTPAYNDLMFEAFAERDPSISFVHVYPGAVRTPMLGTLMKIAFYPLTISPEDCAEHMLYALFNVEGGAHRRDNRGDDMGKKRYYGSEEARRRLWDHTVEEITRSATT